MTCPGPTWTLLAAVAGAAGLAACERGAPAPAGVAAPASASATAPAALPDGAKKLAAFAAEPPRLAPELVELGKLVFFDPRLSGDDAISCATCHDPKKGWADGLKTGVGHKGKPLKRNTPTVINIDHRLPLFWDGRAKDAEEQALLPISNPDEMAEDLDKLAEQLRTVPEYVARFERAFPRAGITKETLAKALAAFERTLLSVDSPYDRYLEGDRAAISPEAARGLELFVGKAACVKCHDGPQLTDNGFHNIGVAGGDEGRHKIVTVALMKGAFKTPGLRDVALTAPYFHDGSAKTLLAVVEHYNRGGDSKDNLDPDIKPLHLTPDEQAALVALMEAMTGRSPAVEPPVLPGAYGKPSQKPLLELMKQADGMLDTLDKVFASMSDKNWPEMKVHCERLLENAEEIDVTRGKTVPASARPEFRAHQGELILAIKALHAAIGAKNGGEAYKSYAMVRERCESCHQRFRWEKGKREEKR